MLKDLRRAGIVRLDERDATLLMLLDGRRSVAQLLLDAEWRCGRDAPARLIVLLADLAERGLVSGVERDATAGKQGGRLARLCRPRERVLEGAGSSVERLYAHGGWIAFTRPALGLGAVLAAAGLVVFSVLLATGGRAPFRVGGEVSVGACVFLIGRLLVAAVHELAHGLAMASFGRRVTRAGVKLLLVFPYFFVDTSDGWFEPRRRRVAISAAGPGSDALVGGTCALLVAVLPSDTARDVAFQLAAGAYLGLLFNLNPLLQRDGYHMLADALRQPDLRRQARRRVAEAIAGRSSGNADDRVLRGYGAAVLAWSLVSAGVGVVVSLRYRDSLGEQLPEAVVWIGFGTFYLALLAPVALAVVPPLLERRRAPRLALPPHRAS